MEIAETSNAVHVKTGNANIVISKDRFDVVHSVIVDGKRVGSGGRLTCTGPKGTLFSAGKPEHVLIDKSRGRVSVRGWFDGRQSRSSLYYIARYEFLPDEPFFRLVLSVVNRFDDEGVEGSWDKKWDSEHYRNLQVSVSVPEVRKKFSVYKEFPYDYRHVVDGSEKPYTELVQIDGSPAAWRSRRIGRTEGRILTHEGKSDKNAIIFYPLKEGKQDLHLRWKENYYDPPNNYRWALKVPVIVRHAAGVDTVFVDQGPTGKAFLGKFPLTLTSSVEVRGSFSGGTAVNVTGIQVGRDVVPAWQEAPDTFRSGSFSLLVKDFDRIYPAKVQFGDAVVRIDFWTNDTLLMGGAGKTFEMMFNFGGDPTEAKDRLYRAPHVSVPPRYDKLDYYAGTNKKYDLIVSSFARRIVDILDGEQSTGWKNWGDYQIGPGYTGHYELGNEQYDLPYGLLLNYLRFSGPKGRNTKDGEILWRVGQAAVYHLMDLDLVKFRPFYAKYNGMVHRKGEMTIAKAHVESEPIVPQGFSFRSLLLMYHLTGDPWFEECARMTIEGFTNYTIPTRLDWASHGDRDSAWILLGLCEGYRHFGEKRYLDLAGRVVDRLMTKYRKEGHFPGNQPVWQGQMLEGLIKYYWATGQKQVRDAVIGHVNYLLRDCIRKTKSGKYIFLYEIDNKKWTSESYESNYAFLWLNALAFAYTETGDSSYLKWADQLFEFALSEGAENASVREATSFLSYPFLYLNVVDNKIAGKTQAVTEGK